MPYSLVSAATLGFDLVRLPAGRPVADVLLTGLARRRGRASAGSPPRTPRVGLDREQRGVLAVRVPPGPRAGRRRAARARRAAGAAGDRAAVLVAQLEQGTIGDAPTLERLLRDDVLGPEHPAAGRPRPRPCAEAAATSSPTRPSGTGPPGCSRRWSAASSPAPRPRRRRGPPVPAGRRRPRAGVDELRAFLGGRPRRSTTPAAPRGGPPSTRAAPSTAPGPPPCTRPRGPRTSRGRTRALAAAQLHAVQAFLDGGFDGRDGASGVWNAVAGCVQGMAMADLLDEGSLAVLARPGCGPDWRRLSDGVRRCRHGRLCTCGPGLSAHMPDAVRPADRSAIRVAGRFSSVVHGR